MQNPGYPVAATPRKPTSCNGSMTTPNDYYLFSKTEDTTQWRDA